MESTLQSLLDLGRQYPYASSDLLWYATNCRTLEQARRDVQLARAIKSGKVSVLPTGHTLAAHAALLTMHKG